MLKHPSFYRVRGIRLQPPCSCTAELCGCMCTRDRVQERQGIYMMEHTSLKVLLSDP